MRFLRDHSSVIAVAFVGAIAVVSIVSVRQERDERRTADLAAAAERQAQICESIRSNRQGLLDLINVVLAENAPSEPVDLDALPEFRAVDPDVQNLVRVLVRPSGGGDAIRERLRGFREGLLATPLPEFCST